MGELMARFDLPLGVGAARDAVRSVLWSWGFRDLDWLAQASVVVSELVSNAVVHGGGSLQLDVQAHSEHVTIGAADGSPVVPRRREADPAGGGRGLALIEAFAARWGVHDHEDGKRVWVRLAPHPRGRSSRPGQRQRTRHVDPPAAAGVAVRGEPSPRYATTCTHAPPAPVCRRSRRRPR
jgi:anti-sigma regulatory factor (Ser/Thr protein kinase)